MPLKHRHGRSGGEVNEQLKGGIAAGMMHTSGAPGSAIGRITAAAALIVLDGVIPAGPDAVLA